MNLGDDIQYVKGIGPEKARRFRELGASTVGDLIGFYPRAYEDRTRMVPIAGLSPEAALCFTAMVAGPAELHRSPGGMVFTRVMVSDGADWLSLTFFNAPYVKSALRTGETYIFYGRLESTARRRVMINPVFERMAAAGRNTGCILPVYRLCAGLSQGKIRAAVSAALSALTDPFEDPLPVGIRRRFFLDSRDCALRRVHQPGDWADTESARRRLVFDECFLLALGLRFLKTQQNRGGGASGFVCLNGDISPLYHALPYVPTQAQRRAIDDVIRDLRGGRPMNRLIQGDVGSGKTLIAAAAAFLTVRSGYQAALMAPTEILAEQHYANLAALLAGLGVDIFLLTGSMGVKARKPALVSASEGRPALYVGTHALLSEGVCFARLGLAVTDEQHRFGVRQRARLAENRGEVPPHLLVMSATPIPRTLALLVYGDLDVSVIDELPPGRTPVRAFVVNEGYRSRIQAFIRRLVGEGRQVYVVCPVIDDIEGRSDLRAASSYARSLETSVFPDLRIGFIHGRLAPAQKEAVMRSFSEGTIDILVATTVIEVGVDVPNAALMVVENAERFGLSQLHQLRGRVGRGEWESYCVLFTDAPSGSPAAARLKVLASTSDGFAIAEEDLRLRGPGDFFGSRQHGLPELRIADLCRDIAEARQAAEAAEEILARDPALELPEHSLLLGALQALFRKNWDSICA